MLATILSWRVVKKSSILDIDSVRYSSILKNNFRFLTKKAKNHIGVVTGEKTMNSLGLFIEENIRN